MGGPFMKQHFLLFLLFLSFCGSAHAEKIVWSGPVNSNGNPTQLVTLTLGETYQISANGTINLGKWWQDGSPLIEDAAYEYNENVKPVKLDSLKNSMNISIGNTFNADHVYKSKPFKALQNGIHFWIQDIDYSDNTGALQVQIVQLDDQK
jgi:hypothetical protein